MKDGIQNLIPYIILVLIKERGLTYFVTEGPSRLATGTPSLCTPLESQTSSKSNAPSLPFGSVSEHEGPQFLYLDPNVLRFLHSPRSTVSLPQSLEVSSGKLRRRVITSRVHTLLWRVPTRSMVYFLRPLLGGSSIFRSLSNTRVVGLTS